MGSAMEAERKGGAPLELEQALFERRRDEYVRDYEGAWILIVGTDVSFHQDHASGYRAGLRAAGLRAPFFLRQVTAHDPPPALSGYVACDGY